MSGRGTQRVCLPQCHVWNCTQRIINSSSTVYTLLPFLVSLVVHRKRRQRIVSTDRVYLMYMYITYCCCCFDINTILLFVSVFTGAKVVQSVIARFSAIVSTREYWKSVFVCMPFWCIRPLTYRSASCLFHWQTSRALPSLPSADWLAEAVLSASADLYTKRLEAYSKSF